MLKLAKIIVIISCVTLFFPLLVLAQEPEVINVDLPGLFQSSVDFRFNQDSGNWEYRRNEHLWRFPIESLSTVPLANYVGSFWWHNLSTAEPLPYGLSLLTPGDFSEEYLNVIRGLNGLDETGGKQYLASLNKTHKDSVTSSSQMVSDPNQYKPQMTVKIGQTELNFETINCKPGEPCEIGWISQYVVAVYKYGVGLAAVLAVVMIMIGGFIWLMSGGSSGRVTTAKDFIVSAMSGLLIALFSFMLLYMVNPRLVNLESVKVLVPNPPERQFVGESEGVGTPTSQSGVAPSTVPLGTNSSLAQIPLSNGAVIDGVRPELSNTMNAMIEQLARDGTLPAGLQITSALRPNDGGSQHAQGTAVDFWWPGIDLESARNFETAILGYNSNLTVLTEVRGDPDFQYFRGNGDGVVHTDMGNILGTR